MTQGENLDDCMEITRLKLPDPHPTVGYYLNILGDCNKQLEVLAAKSIEYATAVRHPRIGKVDAYPVRSLSASRP
jgi:hypothetical protein